MNITVYCGSGMGSKPEYADAAAELGMWIAHGGHRLVYGGSSIGLMGVVSRAVLENGGEVIGVEPQFFIDAGVAQHDLTELIVVQTMAERKTKMFEIGEAFVALPGGVGTLEEITEIMSRMRLRLTKAPCVMLNIDGFYDEFEVLLDKMADTGFLDRDEREAFVFTKTIVETACYLEKWSVEDALGELRSPRG